LRRDIAASSEIGNDFFADLLPSPPKSIDQKTSAALAKRLPAERNLKLFAKGLSSGLPEDYPRI